LFSESDWLKAPGAKRIVPVLPVLERWLEKRGKKSGKVVSGEARELSIVFKIYLAS